jgi:hypothetical protein
MISFAVVTDWPWLLVAVTGILQCAWRIVVVVREVADLAREPPSKGSPVNAADAPALVVPMIPPHPSLPQGGWLGSFPRRSFLELGAYRPAAGSARGHARNVLGEWGLGDFSDAVLQVVSELVSNSVTATEQVAWEGGRPPLRLWLLGGPGAGGGGEVLVMVWDAVDRDPAPRVAGELDEGGRGLAIVECLSGRQWDWYLPGPPHGGKVTRALIDCPWRDQPPG